MSTVRHKAVHGALLSLAVAAASVLAAAGLPAYAANRVASYAFNPTPIGAEATTPTSTAVTVTVTAQDGIGVVVPAAVIYLSFSQTTGGGTATTGAVALVQKPKSFTADSSGKVTITYTTPATFPSSGTDRIWAQNTALAATSTLKAHDNFAFTTVTAFTWNPGSIAPRHTLPPSHAVTVTVTALNGTAADAGALVWLVMTRNTGGGTFKVGTTTVGATPIQFTADSAGHVVVTYTTASVLPPSGTDVIVARNTAGDPTAHARDEYNVF
jgi:hypothetical protein